MGDQAQLLRILAEGTAATTGQEFFRALVRCAAQALGVSGVWVTEYLPPEKSLRALAFWFDDHFVEHYQYCVAGTPCETVIESKRLVNYPGRLTELFPADADLPALNAVSYAGIPLVGPDGAVMGHLGALDSKPFHLDPELESIFRIFASRATAEVTRLRAEADVRASEERYLGLVESAMDAIVEMDESFRITRANSSAVRLFNEHGANLNGRLLSDLMTGGSARKLQDLASTLRNSGQSFTWVPGGLESRRLNGTPFRAEASLSEFESQGRHHYCIILRSIEDQIAAENRLRELQGEVDERWNQGEIAGQSPVMREVLAAIGQVAPAPSSVLITGETGTGKELVARAIHRSSRRANKPFVRVNCAAIPAALAESEFFGHEKGAFTGAVGRRVGRFELANGGTIFLDEIGELAVDLQAKLLRVLQDGEFDPVGSSETRHVDVRVIAATNRDLQARVREGSFREDLFYRLNVFPICVPPLRTRGSDIETLAHLFLERFCRQIGKPIPEIDPDGLRRLRSYDWPGNVRELENVIERAVILYQGSGHLSLRDALPQEWATRPAVARTRGELKEIERASLVRALEAANWKVAGATGAAQALGVPPSTLTSRMKALGVRRPR